LRLSDEYQYPYCDYQYAYCDYHYCHYQYPCCGYHCPLPKEVRSPLLTRCGLELVPSEPGHLRLSCGPYGRRRMQPSLRTEAKRRGLLQVLTRPFCVNEIRTALQYRKNVILVFQTSKDFGGVPGGFAEFYGPELKRAFPHPADYSWLTRNSYVQFYDRGRHVKVGRVSCGVWRACAYPHTHAHARARAGDAA
jgi:hypothetical protein